MLLGRGQGGERLPPSGRGYGRGLGGRRGQALAAAAVEVRVAVPADKGGVFDVRERDARDSDPYPWTPSWSPWRRLLSVLVLRWVWGAPWGGDGKVQSPNCAVGIALGVFVGKTDGALVGEMVGAFVGEMVGAFVGEMVGAFVGEMVGAFVGEM
eukprot:gene57381-biopygen81165